MTWEIPMKFSGKMWLMIILKITKSQGFTFPLEDTFFEKPQGSNWLPPAVLGLRAPFFTEHLRRMLQQCSINVLDEGLVIELLLWWADKRYTLATTTFCSQVLSDTSVTQVLFSLLLLTQWLLLFSMSKVISSKSLL